MMTITEMKALNASNGYFFFERDTMKGFNSRIHGTANDKGFFITSEQFDENSPRLYTLRRIDFTTGDVDTVGKFQQYNTLADARAAKWAL
jgi:hypothetical protein